MSTDTVDQPQTREEWIAERRTGLGGSDSAAAVGQSAWRTPLDVYLSKVGDDDQPPTPEMRRGTVLEPAVRQMYCDETGYSVETPRKILRHPEHSFILASLDGIADGRIVVDLKTARSKTGWGEPGTDEVPVDYLFQVQHYMAVTGFLTAEIGVLFGTNFDFAIYEIPGDIEFQKLLIEAEIRFWARVEAREPPDAICAADVKRLWPIARKGIVAQATPEDFSHAAQLQNIKEEIKSLESAKESLEDSLKMRLGGAEELGYCGNVLATWKNIAVNPKFDVDRFRKDQPKLFSEYLKTPIPQRRFLLKSLPSSPTQQR